MASAGLALLAVGLAQDLAQHLAGGVLRQRIGDENLLRAFVAGERLPRAREDGVRGGALARSRADLVVAITGIAGPGGGSVATTALSLGLAWRCDPIITVGLDHSG